jgi:polyadenylate-binding protein-interacting protein 1
VELALCIKHSISLLLSKSGPENVKCVCQSLKVGLYSFLVYLISTSSENITFYFSFLQLCGFELDTDCKTDTNLILRQLEIIEPSLDVSTGRLVRSVLDLKNKHWGRGETFGRYTN